MASKEVQIRRKIKTSHLPEAIVQKSRVKLGSHFVNSAPLKGLSREEERKYLPQIIGIDPDERSFRKEAQDYWASFSIEVPMSGVVLEVGTDENGEPLNLEDWVAYQWAKKHKSVAESQEEMEGNIVKDFYIYDGERETIRENIKVQAKKKAYRKFIQMSDDKDVLEYAVRLLTNSNPSNMTKEQMENILSTVVDESPDRFLTVAGDKHLKTKASIMEMVSLGVLRKIGNQFLFMDQTIGNTLDEAVAYLTNPKNSGEVTQMKSQLEEARKTVAA